MSEERGLLFGKKDNTLLIIIIIVVVVLLLSPGILDNIFCSLRE